MSTITADPWATLPDSEHNQPSQTPARAPTRYHRPTPDLTKLPEPTCGPHCRRCHHPETRGACRTCIIICDHTKKPRPVDVCIIRVRAPVVASTGSTGRALLLVPRCPHCGHSHVHSAEPAYPCAKPTLDLPVAHPYRRAGCGQPYLLETTP